MAAAADARRKCRIASDPLNRDVAMVGVSAVAKSPARFGTLLLRPCLQARTPENGQLPSAPALICPDILSPSTVPVNCSVSGIGLVMDIFQETSLPLTLPSKISV